MNSQERLLKFEAENDDLSLRTSHLDCQIAIRRLLDDLAVAREDVARLDKALTNTKAAIYGEHGKPSLLGHGHNARYDCGFIANWHSDPNCKIEETARHAEALLLEVHQMTVKVAQEVEAAIDSARVGGSK